MTQYYIIEIKQLTNGEYEHYVHYVWDENRETAYMKAQNKYHEILATAALSNTAKHSAIIIDSSATMVENRSFVHTVPEETPTEEVE